MRIRKFWTLLLLISISFFVAHASVFSAVQDEHCSVNKYVQEISEPVDCGDLCDIHYMFHMSFILPLKNTLNIYNNSQLLPPIHPNEHYQNGSILPSYRPPITA